MAAVESTNEQVTNSADRGEVAVAKTAPPESVATLPPLKRGEVRDQLGVLEVQLAAPEGATAVERDPERLEGASGDLHEAAVVRRRPERGDEHGVHPHPALRRVDSAAEATLELEEAELQGAVLDRDDGVEAQRVEDDRLSQQGPDQGDVPPAAHVDGSVVYARLEANRLGPPGHRRVHGLLDRRVGAAGRTHVRRSCPPDPGELNQRCTPASCAHTGS
jgi:hypothetical protein